MSASPSVFEQLVRAASENQGFVIGLAVAVAVIFATQVAVSVSRGSSASSSAAAGALTQEYRAFPLIERREISHNTRLFRFALPTVDARLGLPLGRHMSLRAVIDGEETRRPYTPTSSDVRDAGYFDLLIKVYAAPHGKMSRHLNALQVGDTVDVRGPLGKYAHTPGAYASYCMVCGGTGITPMWQVLTEILADESGAESSTTLSLVFANVTEDDILLRPELDELAAQEKRFSVYYVLNNPPEGWNGGVGFVSKDILRAQFGAPADDKLVLMCGPPPMNKAMKSHLAELGFAEKHIFKF